MTEQLPAAAAAATATATATAALPAYPTTLVGTNILLTK